MGCGELQLPPGGELVDESYQVFHTKEILWRITRKCPLKCPHCYADAGPKDQDELTTEEAKAIMDSLANSAKSRGESFCIAWMGGEPLAREDIFELMHYAKAKGFAQHMGTSGVGFTPENTKKLKEAGLGLVCVSLDSMDREKHDRLKGKGSFDRAINTINLCKETGIGVMTVFVMTKQNFDEMEAYEKWLKDEHGISCYFSLLHKIGRADEIYEDIALTKEQLQWVYKRKYEKINEYMKAGRTFELPIMELFDLTPFLNTPEKEEDLMYLSWGVGCQGCRFCLGIDFNGDLWPCERMPLTLGNLKTQTLEEIEETELFKKVKDRTGKKGKCAVCEHVTLCAGGCLAETYGSTGDPFDECPYCWYEPKAASKEKVA
jgi:radical SAM protein with 4Fe4S-binding SPASM domain